MSRQSVMEHSDDVTPVKRRIISGEELSMEDYASYLRALSFKPFLTAREACDYFNVGINRLNELMSEPGCPFVTKGGPRARKIHRESFETYMLTHDIYGEGVK